MAKFTTELIQRSGKFTASILSEAADFELFKYFDTAYIYEGSEEVTKAVLCDMAVQKVSLFSITISESIR